MYFMNVHRKNFGMKLAQSVLLVAIIILASILQCDGCSSSSGTKKEVPTWKSCCWGKHIEKRCTTTATSRRRVKTTCQYTTYKCDECHYCNNGGCEHSCTNTDDSYYCSCRKGFLKDGKKCLVICPVLKVPQHAKRRCFPSNPVPVADSVCVFECLPGYKAIKGSTYRICNGYGHWSGDELQCQILKCPVLVAPRGGYMKCSSRDNEHGSYCLFGCYNGYTMIGSAKRMCTKNEHQWFGEWTGSTTFCQENEK